MGTLMDLRMLLDASSLKARQTIRPQDDGASSSGLLSPLQTLAISQQQKATTIHAKRRTQMTNRRRRLRKLEVQLSGINIATSKFCLLFRRPVRRHRPERANACNHGGLGGYKRTCCRTSYSRCANFANILESQ